MNDLKLGWHRVFNPHAGPRGARHNNLHSTARTAFDAGYDFLAWNGTVYMIINGAGAVRELPISALSTQDDDRLDFIDVSKVYEDTRR